MDIVNNNNNLYLILVVFINDYFYNSIVVGGSPLFEAPIIIRYKGKYNFFEITQLVWKYLESKKYTVFEKISKEKDSEFGRETDIVYTSDRKKSIMYRYDINVSIISFDYNTGEHSDRSKLKILINPLFLYDWNKNTTDKLNPNKDPNAASWYHKFIKFIYSKMVHNEFKFKDLGDLEGDALGLAAKIKEKLNMQVI